VYRASGGVRAGGNAAAAFFSVAFAQAVEEQDFMDGN
jgi:hypothetical protein